MRQLFSENNLDDDDYLHECDFFCFATNDNINKSIKDTKITKKRKKK
jgi:hypothetical protein